VVNYGYEAEFTLRSRAKMNIALEEELAKLPIEEVSVSLFL
jgi:hypothetical protein